MPDKHFYRFPTVDFFGKSMPGVLFTLLSISLLPYELVTSIEVPPSMTMAVVVTAIFVVLVVGFTIGQALNTVTMVIQKTVYWMGLNAYRALRFVGIYDYQFWAEWVLENGSPKASNRATPERTGSNGSKGTTEDPQTDTDNSSITADYGSIASVVGQRMKFWLWKRYINFKRIFVPHRKTFENRLKRHLAAEKPEDYPNVDLFEDRYRAMTADFDGHHPSFPSRGETVGDVNISEDFYPLVSSYLTQHGVSRSQRHKALYVFCRNTANVLFLFAVIYAFMSVAHLFVDSLLTKGPDTYIATLLQGNLEKTLDLEIWHLSVLLLATMVNFLYSTGEYKRYYVEYMIADFNHAAPKSWAPDKDRSDAEEES